MCLVKLIFTVLDELDRFIGVLICGEKQHSGFLWDVGVGKHFEFAVLNHCFSQWLNQLFSLSMQMSEHGVRFPSGCNLDSFFWLPAEEKSHSAARSGASGACILGSETNVFKLCVCCRYSDNSCYVL